MAIRSASGLIRRGNFLRVGRLSGLSLLSLALLLLAPDPASPGQRLHIVALGSLEGQFEPCGCEPEPRGGLARRAGALEELRQHQEPILHLDLGNFSDTRTDIGPIANQFLWEALADLGVDAFAVGERELQSWTRLDSLSIASGIPLLATNLKIQSLPPKNSGTSRELMNKTSPWIELQRDGFRIGILSVCSPAAIRSAKSEAGFVFSATPPASAVRNALAEMPQDIDVIVLVSQLSIDETIELSKQLRGVDLILAGQVPPLDLSAAEKESHFRINSDTRAPVIQRSGTRGQYFGHTTMEFNDRRELTAISIESPPLDSRFGTDPNLEQKAAAIGIQSRTKREQAEEADREKWRQLKERWQAVRE